MEKKLFLVSAVFFCLAAWGLAQCNITVSDPKEGDEWAFGSTKTILWNPGGYSGNINLVLLKNNSEVGIIIQNIAAATGSHIWTVGSIIGGSAPLGDGYAVKITTASGQFCGQSAGTFKIKESEISALPGSANISTLPPVQKRQLPEYHVMQFDRIDHGDVVLFPEPQTISIKYGQETLNLQNGATGPTGAISVPEDSSVVNPNGSVKTVVTFTLKNLTTKNLKFNIRLVFGNANLISTEIILVSNQTKNIQWNVNFPQVPGNEPPRYIRLMGPVGTSDDTPICFFIAKLMVRVYAT